MSILLTDWCDWCNSEQPAVADGELWVCGSCGISPDEEYDDLTDPNNWDGEE